MNNKWIVTVKNICIIIIAGIMFAGGMSNYAEAKKADIKRTKINIPMSYHAFYMQTDNDNNIVLYQMIAKLTKLVRKFELKQE